jgi:hypothetical protein
MTAIVRFVVISGHQKLSAEKGWWLEKLVNA